MIRRLFNSSSKYLLVIILTSGYLSVADAKMSIEQQRELFTKASKALKRGHIRTFNRLKNKLKDYPLYPYLEYDYMIKRISRVPEKNIHRFIKTNADSPLSWRLHYSWMKHLARRGKWKKFLKEYRPTSNTRLECYRAWALYRTGKKKAADELTRSLWLVGSSQPRACDKPFDYWIKRGKVTDELRWERIRLAMNKGKVSLARFIAKSMKKQDRRWVNRWIAMRRRPAANLHLKIYQVDQPVPNMIVRYGVKRLARRDVGAAHDYWESVRKKHLAHAPQETLAIDRYIALQAAYQKHPQALEWLAAVEDADEKVQTWRIRVALAQQDWWSALTWIEALPQELKDLEQWRYWRGRILDLQSESLPVLRTAAERIYASLSENRSYHGFLSADRIGAEVKLNPETLSFSEAELRQTESIPGILRARELFFIGRKVDARREWYRAIEKFSDTQLKQASVLANRWGWHDRAIMTVAKAAHFDDLDVRFPVAYKDIILAEANENEVDPAWVYGVMRQESSFMSDARSHAGALGLMQIMPRTGRLTARAEKVRIRSNKDLLNIKKNIRLGTAYLRRMLDENEGNSVLATASYNAGPYRVKRWLPNQDMPSDIWVETIPYSETRNYVKRVMSYTVIYDQKLDGKIERIRTRMPDIKARSSVDS